MRARLQFDGGPCDSRARGRIVEARDEARIGKFEPARSRFGLQAKFDEAARRMGVSIDAGDEGVWRLARFNAERADLGC